MTTLTREDIARRDLGSTTVTKTVVWLLCAGFLAFIAAAPVVEGIAERRSRQLGVESAWSALTGIPGAVRAAAPSGAANTRAGGFALWQRVVSKNRIVLAGLRDFERALEDKSALGRALRPPTQVVMTRWLGAGNQRVYPGRGGWLFYRPDVEYLTGPAFLDHSRMERRVATAPEWTTPPQPDPRPAISAFNRELRARGILLVVVPTPQKPAIHPDQLSSRYTERPAALQNPSYRAFVDDLRREGVMIFDPADRVVASGAEYLATDTHWRPETMEAVADMLGQVISTTVSLPAVADPGYRVQRVEVPNTGDTARMLDLPSHATLFPAERVWTRRVVLGDGSPWRASRDADVLVLGDSFTNIYTLESMGWGTSAGFAEQLSLALGRPVDRLVQNDEGAFATRAMIAREPSRLTGKRVVVYQFAQRELASGDWKIIPIQ